jgi:hypothetical protein
MFCFPVCRSLASCEKNQPSLEMHALLASLTMSSACAVDALRLSHNAIALESTVFVETLSPLYLFFISPFFRQGFEVIFSFS